MELFGLLLGLIASILGIIGFWRHKISHRVWFFAGALIVGILVISLYFVLDRERNAAHVEAVKMNALRRDAETVSSAVTISGWEDAGDYVGYLSQLTGFYRRHENLYKIEYETCARQLAEWQDHLRTARQTGRTVYSSDIDGLRGVVRAGEDQLRKIAAGQIHAHPAY